MLVIILLFLLVIIAFFFTRLFWLKPKYSKMFKKNGDKNRVSISHITLFDLDSVIGLIQKKLSESKGIPLYIGAYSVKEDFEQTQTPEQIKQTILEFQTQLRKSVNFNIMYMKDLYDIFIEIWLKYSNCQRYRVKCAKSIWHLYKSRQIGFDYLWKLLLIFCGF